MDISIGIHISKNPNSLPGMYFMINIYIPKMLNGRSRDLLTLARAFRSPLKFTFIYVCKVAVRHKQF